MATARKPSPDRAFPAVIAKSGNCTDLNSTLEIHSEHFVKLSIVWVPGK